MCGLAPSRILVAPRYGAGGWDAATVRCLPTGTVQVLINSPHGQGHVTTMAQIAAERLGVDFDNVEVLHGDTWSSPWHGHVRQPASPSAASRFTKAAGKVLDKVRVIAAHQLEVAEDDLELEARPVPVKGQPRPAG